MADGPQIAIASENIGRFNFGGLVHIRDHHIMYICASKKYWRILLDSCK